MDVPVANLSALEARALAVGKRLGASAPLCEALASAQQAVAAPAAGQDVEQGTPAQVLEELAKRPFSLSRMFSDT